MVKLLMVQIIKYGCKIVKCYNFFKSLKEGDQGSVPEPSFCH